MSINHCLSLGQFLLLTRNRVPPPHPPHFIYLFIFAFVLPMETFFLKEIPAENFLLCSLCCEVMGRYWTPGWGKETGREMKLLLAHSESKCKKELHLSKTVRKAIKRQMRYLEKLDWQLMTLQILKWRNGGVMSSGSAAKRVRLLADRPVCFFCFLLWHCERMLYLGFCCRTVQLWNLHIWNYHYLCLLSVTGISSSHFQRSMDFRYFSV